MSQICDQISQMIHHRILEMRAPDEIDNLCQNQIRFCSLTGQRDGLWSRCLTFFLLLTPSLKKLPGHTGPHTGRLRHLKRKRVAWFECVRLCEGRGADAILI